MALSAKLQVRQTQSLVITPQLMQAIRLLQMSALELDRFIDAELEQNPLLEAADSEPADTDSAGTAESSADSPESSLETAAGEIDAEPADVFPEAPVASAGPVPTRAAASGSGAGLDTLGIDQTLPATESLDALLTRLIEAVFASAPADRAIAFTLLASLDESGYLTVQPDVIAERLGATPEAMERVLRACQELAPTGIFARSLAECLALQLEERNRLTPPMRMLLANLERLAAGDRASLVALCGVGREGLDKLVAEIRALDPKPGLAFDRAPTRTLIPDVFVRPAPSGGWIVELNDDVLPRLLVNRSYYAKISTVVSREADRRYLSDCLQKASWLEKSLDQRARTVLKVATEIVRRQEGFLNDGVAYLKPLNLRMVADALGIHESTVSRAAANKTIATPRGIFEFRYFFTGAIAATSGGEAHSAEAVKHRIRKMIMNESPDTVLSDDAIVAILSRDGIDIARRTVAKYREVMRIGSSVERRRERRLKAAS
jgi:RNA polymerase sigma-54 factor